MFSSKQTMYTSHLTSLGSLFRMANETSLSITGDKFEILQALPEGPEQELFRVSAT